MKELKLAAGSHNSLDGEACLLEAVAFLAGEPWSDAPMCTCPVIAAYGRALNDHLPDELRPQLTRFIPRLIGTRATPEIEAQRMFLATDYAVRKFAPIGLRARGREEEAARLESLPSIVDRESAAYAAAAAAAYYAAPAAPAAYAASAAAATASWEQVLPLAQELMDKMIDLGPGGDIPDDWFSKVAEIVEVHE